MDAWWQMLVHLFLLLDMMQLATRAHAASRAAGQIYNVDVSQRQTQAFCAERYLS